MLYATLSFWLSYLVSLPLRYQQLQIAPEGLNVSVALFAAPPLIGFIAFVIVANVAMWRGRNWARIVYLIFSVLSVLTFVRVLAQGLQATLIEIVLFVVSTVLDVGVSYLLFTKPGSLWFKTVQPAQ